jgi:hypothetical protein
MTDRRDPDMPVDRAVRFTVRRGELHFEEVRPGVSFHDVQPHEVDIGECVIQVCNDEVGLNFAEERGTFTGTGRVWPF